MSITQFYKGKNVLITGATGFMGKCLLEKLIRTFPDVGKVFIMIRDKPKYGTYLQRCEVLLTNPVFNRLRTENPKFVDKIIPVYGDLLLPKFGMKPEDVVTINQQVNVVFHAGATVSFKEPIRNAVKNKILAVKELCDMCRDIQHLESLVHISTAWINFPDTACEEKLYPIATSTVLTAYENNDNTALAEGLGTFIYTRCKKMGENVLAANADDLPLVIVRPSNVIAALKEPYPGWRDCSHGLIPIIEQVGKGERTMVLGDPAIYMPDLIPADIIINVCLAAAWYRATHQPRSVAASDIPIFNSASGTVNPISQREIYEYARQFGLPKGTPTPPLKFYTSLKAYRWNALTKPLLMKRMRRRYWMATTEEKQIIVKEASYQFDYMRLWYQTILRNYTFMQDNVDRLNELLGPTDKELLPMDPRTIDWENYMKNFCRRL